MSLALSIKDLKKTYKSGTVALKGVNLEIPEGGFYALLGPNGAGKTTIIGTIVGLVNKSSGSVKIFDIDIDKDHDKGKTFIGIVPQEINLNIFEKIIDIVVNQAGYYGIPRSVAIPRAEQVLKDLGLYDKKDQPSQNLSGGMKRRLMIARALIHRPKLLVLDEPTAGVDVELRRGMWDYLKNINKDEGVTILLTTHYLEEAEQLCERASIINKGEIVAEGSIKELLTLHPSGKLEEVFLELTRK